MALNHLGFGCNARPCMHQVTRITTPWTTLEQDGPQRCNHSYLLGEHPDVLAPHAAKLSVPS